MPSIRITNNKIHTVAKPGIVPEITANFNLEITYINTQFGVGIAYWHPDVRLCGVPLPVSDVAPISPQLMLGGDQVGVNCTFQILLYPQLIQAIERGRAGDLKGSVSVKLTYVVHYKSQNEEFPRLGTETSGLEVPFDFSRDEWSRLLQELNYDGGWVVEIPSPSILAAGWERVVAHLERARNELRGFHPQAAAQACRDAWLTAKPFIGERWETTRKIIDRGANAPGEFPPKSARVATTYNDVGLLMGDARFLADAAGHGEEHSISSEDALLIYRLSHALLAHLSRQSRSAESASSGATVT